MLNFQVASLERIGCQLFEAAGCMPEDARAVVEHLVESNVFGHDSHGAIRCWEYAQGLREGLYKAQAKPQIVNDLPCLALVDGGATLGPIGATYAMKLAIEKARSQDVGAVSLRNTCHIGRVGAYPLLAAREGFLSQIYVNAGHHGVFVAPFGGVDGKLSSNPLAFAAP